MNYVKETEQQLLRQMWDHCLAVLPFAVQRWAKLALGNTKVFGCDSAEVDGLLVCYRDESLPL